MIWGEDYSRYPAPPSRATRLIFLIAMNIASALALAAGNGVLL